MGLLTERRPSIGDILPKRHPFPKIGSIRFKKPPEQPKTYTPGYNYGKMEGGRDIPGITYPNPISHSGVEVPKPKTVKQQTITSPGYMYGSMD